MTELKEGDVKIVSKDEALWTRIKESAKSELEAAENSIKINKVLMLVAEEQILKAQRSPL